MAEGAPPAAGAAAGRPRTISREAAQVALMGLAALPFLPLALAHGVDSYAKGRQHCDPAALARCDLGWLDAGGTIVAAIGVLVRLCAPCLPIESAMSR